MFIIAEKARARCDEVRRCRCCETQRAKAGGCRSKNTQVERGKGVTKEREVEGGEKFVSEIGECARVKRRGRERC